MASSVFLFPGSVAYSGSITVGGDIFANNNNASGFLYIGGLPADRTFAGIWQGQASPSASNFIFLANVAAGQTFFNAPNGTISDIELRIGGTTRASVGTSGLSINDAPNTAPTNPLLIKNTAKSTTLLTLTDAGALSVVGSIATAGLFGVSPIVAVSETTGLVAADTNRINYTPAAASSTYALNGVVNVTAWTTPASFTVAVTYKDASGNARTETAQVVRGSTGAAAAAITAIDRWFFSLPAIDIDNSATAITLSTTGTFTGSPVYNIAAVLNRIR